VTALRVLFLGGSGVISSACSWHAVERGIDLWVLNRGQSSSRSLPPSAHQLTADVEDPRAVGGAIGDQHFDAVVDWLAFTPDQVRSRTDLFRGRVGQYVFISSASAYQKPPARLPVTESTPLRNPYWAYSRNKIACEDLLTGLYRDEGYPITIVRPSHTYDETSIPIEGRWTVVDRMRRGLPIIVHGDGTSLWTLTHSRDFARDFVALLGHPRTLGEAFHITGDDVLTWDQIAGALGAAAGAEPDIVHVPSDAIAAVDPDWGAGLLGDKAHSMVFDNSKVRSLSREAFTTTRFEQGAREIVAWHDADPVRRTVDSEHDALLTRLVERFRP
jgi:nucleoside-diphosphate-sugar epimerase